MTPAATVSYRTLFMIFLRAGFSFGGGVSILGTLREEIVEKRRLLDPIEFMELYAIGRIVPAGTMMSLAIAYGHRFRGVVGGGVALAGLLLPGVSLTLGATLAYTQLQGSPALPAFTALLLPAAVALVATAAFKLSQEVVTSTLPVLIAAGAFATGLATKVNPAFVLLGGGLAGLLFIRAEAEKS
jgi:chromate transporter